VLENIDPSVEYASCGGALQPFDITAQLSDFYAQTDTLFAPQTQFRIAFFQEGLQLMGIFFQVDRPALVGLVEGDVDIDAALADIRIDIFYFSAQFVSVDHGCIPFALPVFLVSENTAATDSAGQTAIYFISHFTAALVVRLWGLQRIYASLITCIQI
jgi:hypothetical protein